MSSLFDRIIQKDDLIFSILNSSHQDAAHQLIASCFVNEPVAMHIEPDQNVRLRDAEAFTRYFAESCATNGLSVVCKIEGSEDIAGALYVRDYKTPLPAGLDINAYGSIFPAVSLVMELERQYDELRGSDITKEGHCVDLWMLAVSPRYQRRGIAELLVAAATKLASNMGHKYAVLESTGAFSARCAQKCGMKPVRSQVYSELGTDSLLHNMPLPHCAMTLWEIEL